jgi:nucleoside-diphosphate-sugar epimerase
VTGGSGFIGTNLVEHLRADPRWQVSNLDISRPRHPEHSELWHRVDLRDGGAVRSALAATGPDVIVHLAARTDLDGTTAADYAVNTDGVRSVIDAARAERVTRVLFCSSQLVCVPGHRPVDEFDYCPPNLYGESKVVGERLVREHAAEHFSWALIRPTSIWGPWWGRLYSTFFRVVRNGRYLHPRGMRIHKSFGYVGNAVERLAKLCELPDDEVHATMLYLSDDEPYDIREWADEISAAFGRRPVREVPLWVLQSLARGGDLARRLGVSQPPITSYRLRNICTDTTFDMEPLISRCGPQHIGRLDGVARTAAWTRFVENQLSGDTSWL